MNLSYFKKPALSAIAFFATLAVLSVGYAAYSSLSTVDTGETLSKNAWNTMVTNLSDLNSRWSYVTGGIAYTGGNVGIGTTTAPVARLHVELPGGNMLGYFNSSSPSVNARVRINSTDTASSVAYVWSYSDPSLNKQASVYLTNLGWLAFQLWQTAGSEPTTGATALHLASSGNVGIGGVGTPGHRLTVVHNNASSWAGYFSNTYSALGNAPIMVWARDGGAVSAAVRYKDAGTSMEFYSPSGHTVAYTTSSDYRLKTDVKAMTGALDRIMRLKPDTYRWRADGSYGEGFLAHELQEVVGIAVTGEKDGADETGKPKYQSVDYGKLTPVLTAGIQELKGENDTQTEKIAALETAILELRARCGN